MLPLLDAHLLNEVVLPRLLRMTLVSLVVGGVVGSAVAALARLLTRRRPERVPRLRLCLWGGWLGAFLFGMLPVEANPASLIGGPYGGLWWMAMVVLLVPSGAATGAVLAPVVVGGALARWGGTRGGARQNQNRWLAGLTLVAYLVSALILALLLAAPATGFRRLPSSPATPSTTLLTGYDEPPSSLALSRDGRQLLVLSVRHGRQLLDLLDLEHQRQQRLPDLDGKPDDHRTLDDLVDAVALTPDGRELVTAGVRQVQVRRLAGGPPRLRLDGRTAAFPMAGRRLVTLADPGLRLWDLRGGALLDTIPTAELHSDGWRPLPVAVSPDARFLAFPPRLFGDRIQVWDTSDQRLTSTLRLPREAGILALAFSPDGRQLAVSLGQGPPLSIWDLALAREVRRFEDSGRPAQLFWSGSGLLVGGDEAFQLLNPRSGAVLTSLSPGRSPLPANAPSSPLTGPAALSGDGTTFVAYVPRQGVLVWRLSGSSPASSGSARGPAAGAPPPS